MIFYLLQFSLASILFYLIYILVLNKDTFFQSRRYYLIGSILFSCCLPFLIQWQVFQVDVLTYRFDLPLLEIIGKKSIENTTVTSKWTLESILLIVFTLGCIFVFTKLILSSIKLMKIITRGKHIKGKDFMLVETSGMSTPFSFFQFIVLDSNLYSESELERIILHEREHVDRKHSIDIIIMEILSVFLWFHPMVYLYKKRIKINHEYQADQRVLSLYSRKQYGHILLKQSTSGKAIVFANYFFHSFIKKRIMMMYNKRSNKNNHFKYLLVFPLVFALLFSFSNCSNDTTDGNIGIDESNTNSVVTNSENVPAPPPPPPYPAPHTNSNKEDVFKVVEEMPRFPGCETESDQTSKKICAQKEMLQYIYSNVTYPKIAKENGTEGTVVIQFIVKPNGLLSDINIVRDVADGCGEEAKRAILSMNENGIKWIPGKQQGRTVSVMFTLPIKFKLAG